MSCAYRSHRYRASVTVHPTSVSWQYPTGHAQHPMPVRLPVVHPKQQAVPETSTSADEAPIPVSLVQYLWAQWHQAPPEDRESVARLVANLMRSPRWHWDVTVLPDPSLPDPQHPFVSERDGQPTIGMPITMLRTIWKQVIADVNHYAPTTFSIMQRFVSITDPALWQEFWEELLRNRVRWSTDPSLQYHLYGYLSPRRLPQIAHEIRRLLQSNAPGDRYTALTVLTRWLESPDHETRTVAAQMLHGWPHVVAVLVCTHLSNSVIRDTLERLVPTILTATRPEDRVAWVTTLWTLGADSTLSESRREMIAMALHQMMQDPMVVSVVRTLLRTDLSAQRIMAEPVWDPLLATLIRTVCADEVLRMIEQTLATVRDPIVRRLDPILAAGWGHSRDQRILQIIDSVPGPHWHTVLTEGVTASVGAEVCARIQAWFPRDQVMALIMNHIYAREGPGDWPLAPLPASLIPWVGEAARSHPAYLRPTTIRRLWLANPVRAWHVTQTMLDSGHRFVQQRAIAAMDAGWGTGHDEIIAQTLRLTILDHRSDPSVTETGIATAVAGLGTAPPSLIAALLTELATRGNTDVQGWLVQHMHRGWGRGQDDLVVRVLATIADRTVSDKVWTNCRVTVIRAWDYLPSHVVVSLVDRLVTRATDRLAQDGPYSPLGPWDVQQIIGAFAPVWSHLPIAQVIERIAHHVAHLHEHARTLDPSRRDPLVAAWAAVVTAGMERLSASDIHALLDPLWDLSPHGCFKGIEQWVDR